MGINAVEVAVVAYEFGCGFYTDTADTRNVVGRVTVEGEKVQELRRLNTPFGLYSFDSCYLPGFATGYWL